VHDTLVVPTLNAVFDAGVHAVFTGAMPLVALGLKLTATPRPSEDCAVMFEGHVMASCVTAGGGDGCVGGRSLPHPARPVVRTAVKAMSNTRHAPGSDLLMARTETSILMHESGGSGAEAGVVADGSAIHCEGRAKAVKYPTVAMKLVNSRLCLDCEEVHEDQHCPVCGSESFAFMTRWVTPSDTVAAETARQTRPPEGVERRHQLAKREQVDAYRQILNPTQTPRRGRMVAGGALGLALIGVARMLWRAAPNPKEGDGNVAGRDRQSGKGMN